MFTERYDPLDFDKVLPEDERRAAAPTNGLRLTPGTRYPYLLSKAGALQRLGVTREAMLACLLAENAQRCDPPKPAHDIQTLVDDINRRYVPDDVTRLVDHVAAQQIDPRPALDPDALHDAVQVAAEGQAIAHQGITYLVDGLVPDYGELGMTVAYAKVGKTMFSQRLGAAVATGTPFLDRETQRRRVLVIAAEDPPEYTAWLARSLTVPAGAMTFYRQPIQLDADGLARITTTVDTGGYGLVLIASWQAVVAGLVRDENDNAGAVLVVERVKAATRACGVPWLIDAHSGKGEDQTDDADPTRALRGASAAAGSADFMLSLRYAHGPFSPQRRLSGKGRFVTLEPLLLDYDAETGVYQALGDTKAAYRETTWRLIVETGALTNEWRTVTTIARQVGLISEGERLSGGLRKRLTDALIRRPGVDRQQVQCRGQETTSYRRSQEDV